METEKNHTVELVKLVADVPALINGPESQIAEVAERMTTLQKAALIYATEFWRKDGEGQPKYFYLLYPQKNGEFRRRVYVGCDAERIKEARAGIVRANEYAKLATYHLAFTNRAHRVAEALRDATRYLPEK